MYDTGPVDNSRSIWMRRLGFSLYRFWDGQQSRRKHNRHFFLRIVRVPTQRTIRIVVTVFVGQFCVAAASCATY